MIYNVYFIYDDISCLSYNRVYLDFGVKAFPICVLTFIKENTLCGALYICPQTLVRVLTGNNVHSII